MLRGASRFVLGLAPPVAGIAALPFAGIINWLACESEGTEACGRKDLAELQYGVAWAGLVPALVFSVAFLTRRRRTSLAAFLVAVAVYAAWALLADAAVHGWDDLRLVPFAAA